ncbi:MAG: UvrD-helicase domain-containing protein [Bdellovibrionaceae bacterium]|nr:UvrD-helicase domain-containing protein [Bdellovibrionales bacterium]MCB9084755.1 UvrD-helicase domain-containing protein [Pseudobdellovibrionaceae bacterium]
MSSAPFELNHQIVRAGAGAGKTTTLTKTVMETALSFDHSQGRFPRIVVTTFTRKATQELRERLVAGAVATGRNDFLDYVSSRSNLHISTIHGVLSLFLRRYGHLLELDTGFKILSEADGFRLAKTVFRKQLLESAEASDLVEIWSVNELVGMLRSYHEMKLQYPEARALQLTDCGELFRALVYPLVLSLREIISQAREQTDNEKWQIYFTGLERLFVAIERVQNETHWTAIETANEALGRKPNFSSKTSPAAFSPELKEKLDEDLKSLKALLEKEGVGASSWNELVELAVRFQSVADLFHENFTHHKRSTGQLEMGDLELLARDSLRKFPQVGEAFSQEWDYWLIDEFQDTSPLQVELLDLLIGDRKAFVVGDPQQSIYLFRGARSEVFQERWKVIGSKGGDQREKAVNYRSQPSLLLFFNDVFRGLGSQFRPMEPRSPDLNTDQPVAYFAVGKDYDGEVEGLENSELAAIIHHIERLRSGKAEFQDICILGRTNGHLADLARKLQAVGYPIHLHAASGFYDRREIRDAMSLVRFFLNVHDDANLFTLVRSPFFRVSDDELAHIMSSGEGSLWQKLIDRAGDCPAVRRLKSYLQMSHSTGVAWAVRRAILDDGVFSLSFQYDGTGRREANLWKFIKQVVELERKPGSRFIDLSDRLGRELSPDEESSESDAVTALEPDRINLMTIHSSKGLQFPHVLLPRCDRGNRAKASPSFGLEEESGIWAVSRRSPLDGEKIHSLPALVDQARRHTREMEESERLLYVALTRAKDTVFCSWSEKVQSNSWAEKLNGWVREPGQIKRPSYCFEVELGPWSVETNLGDRDLQQSVPEKAMHPEDPTSHEMGPKFSVSEYLEEKLELPQMEQLRPGAEEVQSRVQASNEGILIHRLMETLHFDWDFDCSAAAEEWFGPQASKARTAIDYVRSCQEPPMRDLIQGGEVEWGFQVPTAKGILEGQIDLWGRDSEGQVWLIDYKSGSEKYLDKALHQLSLYSVALRKLGIKEEIRLAVVYPLTGKSHFRQAPSEAQLVKLFPELF